MLYPWLLSLHPWMYVRIDVLDWCILDKLIDWMTLIFFSLGGTSWLIHRYMNRIWEIRSLRSECTIIWFRLALMSDYIYYQVCLHFLLWMEIKSFIYRLVDHKDRHTWPILIPDPANVANIMRPTIDILLNITLFWMPCPSFLQIAQRLQEDKKGWNHYYGVSRWIFAFKFFIPSHVQHHTFSSHAFCG